MGIFRKKEKEESNHNDSLARLVQNIGAVPDERRHLDESEICYQLLRKVLVSLDVPSGSLYIHHNDRDAFVLQKWIGEKPLAATVAQDYEFLRFLKQWHKPVFKDEVFRQKQFLDVRSAAAHFFTQLSCAVTIPLFQGSHCIGLINLGRKASTLEYREEDHALFQTVGALVAQNLAYIILKSTHQKLNTQVEESLRVKNELMANVSHELRTPLNGILGLTGMLLEEADGPLNPDQRRHLDMIKSAGEALLEIVNNILSLIKIEAGKSKSEIKRIDLSKLVGEIGDLFEGLFKMQGNVFQVMIPGDLSIYGDEDQIRTVLINLIGNAAKFTKNGQIEVLAQKSGDVARICVKDTGPGIPDEEFENIFEEFRQVDGSVTREHGGTGLGLAIAKKLVEIHGGRIWVDSVIGKGSEFYVTLPLKAVDLPASEG